MKIIFRLVLTHKSIIVYLFNLFMSSLYQEKVSSNNNNIDSEKLELILIIEKVRKIV